MAFERIKRKLKPLAWRYSEAVTEVMLVTVLIFVTGFWLVVTGNQATLFLLPEWAAMSFFVSVDSYKKQIVVTRYQDNQEQRINSARNLSIWMIGFSVALYSYCLLVANKVLVIPPPMIDSIENVNLLVALGALYLNFKSTLEILKVKSLDGKSQT
ncbi:hypothetical protein ACPV48_24790 [Vibrio harveyi]|uniref:hypothetical protein n=1 Tax=Vibrio harveyi TaxID=669 RepID=UPI0040691B50